VIEFRCWQCGHKFRVAESAAGQRGKCKTCGARCLVPEPERTPTAPPPATTQPPAPRPSFVAEPLTSRPFVRPAVSAEPLEPPPTSGKIHVITERTSKRYKAMTLVGTIGLVSGLFLFMLGVALSSQEQGMFTLLMISLGLILIIPSVALRALAAFLSWWHHG
jgi:DNA-directed RNA polymerase subunit RPC12/RpoP